MSDDGHGKVHGRFTISTRHGVMLKKMLLAIAAPKHQTAVNGAGSYQRQASPQRLGQAFVELIERYPTDQLPKVGGVNATVVVTMSLESLLGGLRAAALDTGEPITATEARRLACEAGIIPAVLGSDGVVLDLGRKARFHTEPMRTTAMLEQKHCQHPTCDWPAWLCHLHHPTPWSHGGATSTTNAQLLCPRHHALALRRQPMRT